jgi:hypothetical protein
VDGCRDRARERERRWGRQPWGRAGSLGSGWGWGMRAGARGINSGVDEGGRWWVLTPNVHRAADFQHDAAKFLSGGGAGRRWDKGSTDKARCWGLLGQATSPRPQSRIARGVHPATSVGRAATSLTWKLPAGGPFGDNPLALGGVTPCRLAAASAARPGRCRRVVMPPCQRRCGSGFIDNRSAHRPTCDTRAAGRQHCRAGAEVRAAGTAVRPGPTNVWPTAARWGRPARPAACPC